MAILNYSSKIEASVTIGEINAILSKFRARKITLDNDEDGYPVALTFGLSHLDSYMFFTVPCDYKKVLEVMRKQGVRNDFIKKDQAVRTSWRIIKDWIEAQLALIESEQVTVNDVFLPFALTRNGQTVREMIGKDTTLFLSQ